MNFCDSTCGDLNRNGPHRLIFECLGSSVKCGLIGVGVVLLEEVYHWGCVLEFEMPGSVAPFFLLLLDPHVEL